MNHTMKLNYNEIKLMISLSIKDFQKKYAGSTFGVIWAFIQPLLTIIVYWLVFQFAFKSQAVDGNPFILWFMGGMVPWLFFSEAFSAASNCFLEYNYLVKKVVFNIDILPIVKIFSCFYVHLFFLIIYLLICIFLGFCPSLHFIQIIYYLICLICFLVSVSYFFATASVFFRDVSQIIGIILLIGMWATPIAWNLNIFSPSFQKFLWLNPMVYIVEGYRDSFLMNGEWFWESPNKMVIFWLTMIILYLIGKKFYLKTKIHFSDVL